VLTIAGVAGAADWPSRPIVVLDGFAPGGGTDVFTRNGAAEYQGTLSA
jgi:tripartite-type tricarboxylate transporter receptor subunit TctC